MKKTLAYLLGSTLLAGALLVQMPANSQPDAHLNQKDQLQAVPIANEDLDFVLVNSTGYDIAALYLSPTSKNTWGPNVLEDILADGEGIEILFHPEAEAANWDLKVEWDDGDTPVVWQKLNLTTINKLTIYYDEDSGKTTAKAE